jgi:hypothetical protein
MKFEISCIFRSIFFFFPFLEAGSLGAGTKKHCLTKVWTKNVKLQTVVQHRKFIYNIIEQK